MANMGSRKHLKRYKAPKTWPIHPKEKTWTVKPAAGPHAIEDSLSLLVVVRDILGIADNAREAKRIINSGNVLIDGRVKKDYKYPVGLPGLQIKIAFVFGVINFSNASIGGSAKPVSIPEITGTTFTPEAVEKPL